MGGGDYSRKAIILNVSVKEGRLIEGRLLFEEIRYPHLISYYTLLIPLGLGRILICPLNSSMVSALSENFSIGTACVP